MIRQFVEDTLPRLSAPAWGGQDSEFGSGIWFLKYLAIGIRDSARRDLGFGFYCVGGVQDSGFG